jgi:alanyl aminopeptidase
MREVIAWAAVATIGFGFGFGCGTPSAPPRTPITAAGSGSGPTTTAAGAEPPPAAPGLRLPRAFVPTEYKVKLAITPSATTFSGATTIVGTVPATTRVVWLHAADGLTLSKAIATTSAGTFPVDIFPVGSAVALRPKTASFPAGELRLAIDFTGVVKDRETQGAFHQQDGGAWYTYTQLESISARAVFPCFDEPDVKVPWELQLEVPTGDIALSNTPVVDDTPSADGKTHTVSFARTKPLPSYLVAFAVGPFEKVDAGATRDKTPIQIVVPKGRTAEAAFAVEATRPLVDRLEDYFGIPYPYPKLDLIAVPHFPGAMENPGLITYGASILLAKPDATTIGFRRLHASISAHELAHQWFGDLVTMAWWDDVWLNEAFATWMGEKTVAAWKPEWNGAVGAVAQRSGAMGADSLKTARRIRQPIANEGDIKTAFDNGITYAKGASVIRMFETWVGEETFKAGIRSYLTAHAWGNATSADFLAAIGTAAKADVATPFSTFLDQVGSPLVTAELSCPKGGTPTLALAQSRYVPIGSDADTNQTWQIPICASYAVGKTVARDCTVLTAATGELPLTHATACPTWVLPNAGLVGYYRTAPSADLQKRLVASLGKLSLAERVGIVADVEALVAAGKTPAGDGLALVGVLAKDSDPHIVSASLGIAAAANEVISDKLRPNYRRFLRKVFGAKAKALGWKPKAGEDEDTAILRSKLLGLVAGFGEDKALTADARKLALAWLDDKSTLSVDIAPVVVSVAVATGDAALYDRFLAAAKATTDPHERAQYLNALGGFRDPALVARSFAVVTGDEFNIFETRGVLVGAMSTPENRPIIYKLLKENFDALAKKIPEAYLPYMSVMGAALCDASMREDVEDFFTARMAKIEGAERTLAQSFEQMDLCIASRAAQRPGVEAFLKKY